MVPFEMMLLLGAHSIKVNIICRRIPWASLWVHGHLVLTHYSRMLSLEYRYRHAYRNLMVFATHLQACPFVNLYLEPYNWSQTRLTFILDKHSNRRYIPLSDNFYSLQFVSKQTPNIKIILHKDPKIFSIEYVPHCLHRSKHSISSLQFEFFQSLGQCQYL